MKPNDKQKPGCFDENIVFDQLEASGTIAFHTLMQMGYPVKVPIAEFYQKIKPYMTPGHGYESIGTINCCRFFLLASGFLSKDFKLYTYTIFHYFSNTLCNPVFNRNLKSLHFIQLKLRFLRVIC